MGREVAISRRITVLVSVNANRPLFHLRVTRLDYTARATLRKFRIARDHPSIVHSRPCHPDAAGSGYYRRSGAEILTDARSENEDSSSIVRSAAEGITDTQELVAVAVAEGRVPAL